MMSRDKCCKNVQWKYLSDASHADGCEFTHGQCTSCGTNLINLHVPVAPESGAMVIVSPEFVSTLNTLSGKARKEFMREWYNGL